MAIVLTTDDTRREVFLKAEQAKVQTGGGGTTDHRELTHRSDPNQHPISAITGLQEELDGINAKIPAQASATNQLADKDFVNSSIENVAAYYITKDAAGNPFATKAELDAATVFYSGGQIRVPTRNDYTVVLHDESKEIEETGEQPTTRYLYDNGWSYQYIVNNSGLTADQWKAVNSGATAEIIESVANKQDKLTAGARISIDSDNVISAEEQVLIVTAAFDQKNMIVSNASHTVAEIVAAYDAGKAVFLRAGATEFDVTTKSGTVIVFSAPTGSKTYTVTTRSSGDWPVTKIEKVDKIGDYPSNSQYPSALAVKNYVNSVIGNVSAALSAMDAVIGGDEP